MSLSVDNLIGVQPTTTSSTNIQAQIIDVYNGTTNFHRLTSSASAPLQTINIPNASGTLILNTATQTLSNKMNHAQVGSAADPSYSFAGDVDTGFFRSAANTIGISTNGVSRVTIDDTSINPNLPIYAPDGVFNAPSYSFAGAVSTGMYHPGANRIGLIANGQPVATLTSNNFLMNKTLLLQDGNNSTPSLTFNSDTNSGFYSGGNDIITVTVGGANHSRFSASGFQVFSTNGCRSVDGTLTTGGFNFSSENGLGIYRAGVGDMRLISSGTESLGVESQGIKLYGSVAGANANYAPSKLSYYENTTHTTKFLMQGGGGINNITGNLVFKITRIGNLVNITMPPFNQTITNDSGGNASCVSQTALDARFRPTGNSVILTMWGVKNGNNNNDLILIVQTNGNINIDSFANNDTFFNYGTSFSYTIA